MVILDIGKVKFSPQQQVYHHTAVDLYSCEDPGHHCGPLGIPL